MRNILANFVFWVHGAFIIFWFGLFFIPQSIWPGRIVFQFYFTVIVVAHQLTWGLLIMPWTKKYRMVCILTTIHHLLRGQKISDPENYDRNFTKEFLGKAGINFPHRAATIITFATLILATIQYFFLS